MSEPGWDYPGAITARAMARLVRCFGVGALMALCCLPAGASIRRHHWQPAAAAWHIADPEKDAALIVDGETGKALYARNADALRHPASLTKMMTLYLLFEQLRSGQMTLATPLFVSEHAAVQKPTKLSLRPGSSIPVDTAIKAIVVRSANDVAVVIAESIGGSEGHFAELMTAKARELGMSHTYFHNASGLPDPLQITSASDLALLARHLAYDFPQYFHYFSTYSFNYRGATYYTHDNLIGRYDGADGIKTGYTGASGFNLVSSVVRNGVHIIGVVMGGTTAHLRDNEMMHLLDDTFATVAKNPQLVARANIPWQAIADNAPSRPVIAGFQLGGDAAASPKSQLLQPGTALFTPPQNATDDEDAAESRPDSEYQSNPHTPPMSGSEPKVPAVNADAVASESLDAAPSPAPGAPAFPDRAMGPSRLDEAAYPAPARGRVPVPEPKPAIVLASYQPPAVPVVMPELRTVANGRGEARPAPLPIARPLVAAPGGADWTIQIGAFADADTAKTELASYAARSTDVLGQAARIVAPFPSAEGHTVYRARFGPFDEREARDVCQILTIRGQTCFAAVASR